MCKLGFNRSWCGWLLGVFMYNLDKIGFGIFVYLGGQVYSSSTNGWSCVQLCTVQAHFDNQIIYIQNCGEECQTHHCQPQSIKTKSQKPKLKTFTKINVGNPNWNITSYWKTFRSETIYSTTYLTDGCLRQRSLTKWAKNPEIDMSH